MELRTYLNNLLFKTPESGFFIKEEYGITEIQNPLQSKKGESFNHYSITIVHRAKEETTCCRASIDGLNQSIEDCREKVFHSVIEQLVKSCPELFSLEKPVNHDFI